MFCGKCGTERNNENARFCRACGAAFHTSPPQPTSLAQPMREQLEGLGEATAVRAVDVAGLPAEQRTGPTGPNPSAVDRDKAEPPAERAGHIAHPLDEWTSGQPSPIRPPAPTRGKQRGSKHLLLSGRYPHRPRLGCRFCWLPWVCSWSAGSSVSLP